MVLVVLLVVVVFKPGSSGPPKYGMIPTGSSPQADAQQVAAAFLAAWESTRPDQGGQPQRPARPPPRRPSPPTRRT